MAEVRGIGGGGNGGNGDNDYGELWFTAAASQRQRLHDGGGITAGSKFTMTMASQQRRLHNGGGFTKTVDSRQWQLHDGFTF